MRRLLTPVLATLACSLAAAAAPARQPVPAQDNPYGLHSGGGMGLRPPAGFTVGPRLDRYRNANGDKSRKLRKPAKTGAPAASGAGRRQPAQPAE